MKDIHQILITIALMAVVGVAVWFTKPITTPEQIAEQLTKSYKEQLQAITNESFESQEGMSYCQAMLKYWNDKNAKAESELKATTTAQ